MLHRFQGFNNVSSKVCGLTYQLSCRMLCKPHRGKAICATGQQGDDDMHKRDPVGEVGPKRNGLKNVVHW